MNRHAVLPASVLPRGVPLRARLLLVLAFAAAAAAFLLLRTLAQEARPGRSTGAPATVDAEPEAAVPPAETEAVPSLRVLVRDAEGLPLAGARCEVLLWNAAAESDSLGIARLPAAKGAPADVTVRVSLEGYRPASKRGRLLAEREVKLKLLKAPTIRVFDDRGDPVKGYSSEPSGADLRERTLHADGYLRLDLGDRLLGPMLHAWDDLLARSPVDIYLVRDEGLGQAVLRVDHPDGAAVAMGIDVTWAKLPDIAPRLRTMPFEWSSYYLRQWRLLERLPRGPAGPVGRDDVVRVYAEGPVIVTCLAPDCRPLQERIDVAPGTVVTRTLALAREPWVEQQILVTDRFGRPGTVSVELLEPAPLRLASQGTTLRVPRGGGPYTLRVDGGARGNAVRTVGTLPSKEPIRFELTGIEVHLKLVDDESGEPIEGISLAVEGRAIPVAWKPDEGSYVFGPVDPGIIGLVHDPQRRVELLVDPAEAEKGVLRREVRVRGFPTGAAGESD